MPYDGLDEVEGEEDELEEAATVLMTGPAAEAMLDDLRGLYQRSLTDEVPIEEPESESQAAAFRLVVEEESLPLAVGTQQPVAPPVVTSPVKPWLLVAGALAVGGAIAGAMQLL